MATATKVRDSNIELFRILLMLMIIAHHYVNHGITADQYDYSHLTGNQIFLLLWGWGGKTGVNCFLLITGYFMCQQSFTWKKFLKLYLEIKFYCLLIPVVFWAIGKQPLSFSYCFETLFGVAMNVGSDFPPTFLAMLLLVPFINRLIKVMDSTSHLRLLVILLLIYTITGTMFFNSIPDHIGWYVTVYLMGAYLRLYTPPVIGDVKKSLLLVVVSLSLCFGSIVFFAFTKNSLGFTVYYLVSDSNQILAVLATLALFAFFKSINLGHNRWINLISTATFGVFLIHDQANMREWLWKDMFCAQDYFTSDRLWLHALCTLAIIYVSCVIIDIARQRLIEKPLFTWLDKRYPILGSPVI